MKSSAAVIVSAILLLVATQDPCEARNRLLSRIWRCPPKHHAPTTVARPPACCPTRVSPSVADSTVISEPMPTVVAAGNVEMREELPAPVGVGVAASADQPSELNLMMTAELVALRKQLDELKAVQSEQEAALAEAKQLVGERGKELDKKIAEFVTATQRAEEAETALAAAKKESQAAVAANKKLQKDLQKAAAEKNAAMKKLKADHDAALVESQTKLDAELKKLSEQLAAAKTQAAQQVKAAKEQSEAMAKQLDKLNKELQSTKKQLQKAKQPSAENKTPENSAEQAPKKLDQPAESSGDKSEAGADAGDKSPAE